MILASISNYIHYKMSDEIIYAFPNFNDARLGMDIWFPPTLYWACDNLSMLGLKSIYVGKIGPSSPFY